MSKNILRKHYLKIRHELYLNGDLEIISSKIVNNILNSEFFKQSKNIAIYYPIKDEVNILDITTKSDKKFYLPKCINNNLYFAQFSCSLKKGTFSIPEPQGKTIDADILDLIFIPAICCNHGYYRLGYGKGFYDRFFAYNLIKARKIIVLPSCCITNEFVEDEFDYKCDNIICENTII